MRNITSLTQDNTRQFSANFIKKIDPMREFLHFFAYLAFLTQKTSFCIKLLFCAFIRLKKAIFCTLRQLALDC
jgi:hypothetical protein